MNKFRPIVRSCSTGDVHEVNTAGPLAVRSPRDYREILRGPTPPPIVHNVIERAPTPDPDVYERVCSNKILHSKKIKKIKLIL